MSGAKILRMEIDGHAATADGLFHPALVNFGHFTAMQVRNGMVRGLDLHLTRLDTATRELFDTGLDGNRVRRAIRHSLGDDIADASVRATVFRPVPGSEPSVMVTVREPGGPPIDPQRLRPVAYLRPVPHVKHTGTFALIYHGQLAERAGFDDALLVGPGDVVSETTMANVGFFDGSSVVWPDAPALRGITMQLLDAALSRQGVPSRHAPVRLADLPSFASVFVTNSLGVARVAQVNGVDLRQDASFVDTLTSSYDGVGWDII